MHDNRKITEGRIERFVRDSLIPALYIETVPLTLGVWDDLDEPLPFADAVGQSYRPIELPRNWGKAWSTSWFHVTGQIPQEWLRGTDAATRVELVIDLGFTHDRPGFQVEGLVYRPDGTTVKSINPRSSYVPVPQDGSGAIDLYVEGAANPNIAGDWTWKATGLGEKATAGDELLYVFQQCDAGLLDITVWELTQDVWTLLGLMEELPIESPRRHRILGALERMVDVVDPCDVSATAAAGREALAPALALPASASSHHVVAIGHAHIDSAWLWPIRETIRKCARTFSSVVALMDADPEFRFACSSAQQLKWMKDGYPELFARIKEKVANGQFIPVGGMWVEPDMNLPGAEAMVRQFVAGKRFFLEEFGVDTREAWIPDTFGYSGAIPQIIKASGTEWFLTQKISWNQTNTFPHHTFLWEGIDGTRLFTHFPPADTYVGEVSGSDLGRAQRTFHDHRDASVSLLPFGFGDGGGGPTREMMAAVTPHALARGLADRRDRHPGALLRARRSRAHAASGVERRAVPRAAPRELHDAALHEAGQSPERALAPRGRAVGDDRRRAHRRGLPVRRPGAHLAARPAAAVPRHPSRHLDRVGAPRGRGEQPRTRARAAGPHRFGTGELRRRRRRRVRGERLALRA